MALVTNGDPNTIAEFCNDCNGYNYGLDGLIEENMQNTKNSSIKINLHTRSVSCRLHEISFIFVLRPFKNRSFPSSGMQVVSAFDEQKFLNALPHALLESSVPKVTSKESYGLQRASINIGRYTRKKVRYGRGTTNSTQTSPLNEVEK